MGLELSLDHENYGHISPPTSVSPLSQFGGELPSHPHPPLLLQRTLGQKSVFRWIRRKSLYLRTFFTTTTPRRRRRLQKCCQVSNESFQWVFGLLSAFRSIVSSRSFNLNIAMLSPGLSSRRKATLIVDNKPFYSNYYWQALIFLLSSQTLPRLQLHSSTSTDTSLFPTYFSISLSTLFDEVCVQQQQQSALFDECSRWKNGAVCTLLMRSRRSPSKGRWRSFFMKCIKGGGVHKRRNWENDWYSKTCFSRRRFSTPPKSLSSSVAIDLQVHYASSSKPSLCVKIKESNGGISGHHEFILRSYSLRLRRLRRRRCVMHSGAGSA